jgi:hypothetical protein
MQHGADLLVSSRGDTVKAKKAAERHIPIMGYVEFLAQLGTPVTPAARSRFRPDAWVDTHVAVQSGSAGLVVYGIHTIVCVIAIKKPVAMAANCAHPARMVFGPGGL